MNKIEKFLTINKYSRAGIKLNKVKEVIWHWVGNAGSSAIANRNYFESLKDKHIFASSHYIVGLNGEIIQNMPEDEVAYHSGNYTVNCNSIGIEVCHPDWTGEYSQITINSLIELTAEILKKNGLNQNNIRRHYDITGKKCPKYYVENNDAYLQLKRLVAEKLENTENIIDEKPPIASQKYQVGDVVTINGVYTSSSSNNKLNPVVKTGSITKIIAGANNPYLLNNGNIGWVNNNCIIETEIKVVENTNQSNTVINVGARVVLSNSSIHYATGESIPQKYKGKIYTIQQIGSNKVLLQELYSWVRIQDLEGISDTTVTNTVMNVGNRVKIRLSAINYCTGEKIPNSVKEKEYTILQVATSKYANGILLKEIMSWVDKSDLILI